MKTYYSSSKYANYVHIHIYVLDRYFIKQVKKAGLDYDGSYTINADIDGNIATWKLTTKEPQIEYIFNEIANNPNYINKNTIKKATKEVAAKIGKKFEIKDSELLLKEIRSIKLSNKKPEIEDNDDLDSPAVRFY